MAVTKPLKNERYRMATQLREGMEVREADGATWTAITHHLYITAPVRVVSLTLADGAKFGLSPRDQVMSRVPEATS